MPPLWEDGTELMFYLLAKDGHRTVCVMQSQNLQEVLDFAQAAKVTGVLTEKYLEVDHSGEMKIVPDHHVNEAFRNLTTQSGGSGNE